MGFGSFLLGLGHALYVAVGTLNLYRFSSELDGLLLGLLIGLFPCRQLWVVYDAPQLWVSDL